jgi:hypothetical protein
VLEALMKILSKLCLSLVFTTTMVGLLIVMFDTLSNEWAITFPNERVDLPEYGFMMMFAGIFCAAIIGLIGLNVKIWKA